MFPVKDALLYVERHPLGGPKKGFQGDAFYTAENPPYGALFTAYMKEKIKTKKEKRQDAEKDAAKKNVTPPYPTKDELRAEAEEAKPEIYFVVYDESGAAIRRVDASADAGFQRVAWDLRYSAPRVPKHSQDGEEDFPDSGDLGPLVLSGSYSARLFQRVGGVVTELAGPHTFKVVTEGSASDDGSGSSGAGTIHVQGDAALPGGIGRAAYRGRCGVTREGDSCGIARGSGGGETNGCGGRWHRATGSRDLGGIARGCGDGEAE